MQKLILLILLYITFSAAAQTKIIDMHIHAYDSRFFTDTIHDPSGKIASVKADSLFINTYAAFKKYNIVKAAVSGSPKGIAEWAAKDNDHIIIKAIGMSDPSDYHLDTVQFKQMIIDKKIEIFGEIGAYYAGTTVSDSVWQPYLSICERYDIPVAVHTGGGPPEDTYHGAPKARLQLSDPFLLEDVLVRYPKLRIYLMHSGEVWYEHAVRLMMYYPQVYSDLGAILWIPPIQHYAINFLKEAKEAGCLDRVMFGTDQMYWAEAIRQSISFLQNLPFLTKQEKEDIFYNNAVRFLRLKK